MGMASAESEGVRVGERDRRNCLGRRRRRSRDEDEEACGASSIINEGKIVF
jgi:hypothetical protein